MKLREEPNEHGTTTSYHTCDTCGVEFSITPAADFPNCMSDDCASYDPHRDADILFMTGQEIAREKKIVSISKLRERLDGPLSTE